MNCEKDVKIPFSVLVMWPFLEIGSFRIDQVELRLSGWALTQNDWSPCETGKFEHRGRHTQREDDGKRRGEDSHLQIKEFLRMPETRGEAWNRSFPSAIRGSTVMPTSWLRTFDLRNCETIYCYFKSIRFWCFVTAALAS